MMLFSDPLLMRRRVRMPLSGQHVLYRWELPITRIGHIYYNAEKGFCQYLCVFFLRLYSERGLIISRQSKSPWSRAEINASAVAILVAIGTL